MTTSDKLREIARKHFPIDKDVRNNTIYNQIQQSKQDSLLSDLTALISEGYVTKEKYMDDLCDEYQRGFEDGRAEAKNNDRL